MGNKWKIPLSQLPTSTQTPHDSTRPAPPRSRRCVPDRSAVHATAWRPPTAVRYVWFRHESSASSRAGKHGSPPSPSQPKPQLLQLAPDVQFQSPTPKYPLENFHLVSTQHIKFPGNFCKFADTKNTFPFQGTEISKYPGKIEETKSTSPFKGTKICRNKECVSL